MPALPERLSAWLAAGHHGGMGWMEERTGERADPARLWPEVRSIVMLGVNAGPDGDPLAALAEPSRGSIAVYARRRDYHDVIKGKLKELGGAFAAKAGAKVKVFVDTAPVMEKPLAAASGLGWQGKHSVLVSRGFGNWLLLGRSTPRPRSRRIPPRATVAAAAAAASMPARPAPSRPPTSSMPGAASPT